MPKDHEEPIYSEDESHRQFEDVYDLGIWPSEQELQSDEQS